MFRSIYQVMEEGQALSLHLIRKGDKLTVCFQPLSSGAADAAGGSLTPLVITGTPAELEEGFIAAIRTPLAERFGLLANLEEFNKSTQKAQPKVKDKTEEAGTVNVEAAAHTLPKKSKRDEQAEAAEKLAKAGNLPGAYGVYKKLYEQDKADTKAANRMHELWAQMSQQTIFPEATSATATEDAPDVQPVMPQAGQPQAIASQGTEEASPVAREAAAEEDLFARILNAGRIEGPPVATEEVEAAPIPPGIDRIDPARYEEFLRYQEYLKSQQVPETV